MKKVLLSLAGLDPSAGAGVLLDVRVFQHMGFTGTAIPTTETIQNTCSVEEIFPHESRILIRQFKTLDKDISVSGIKVGMVGSRSNLKAVSDILMEKPDVPVVVDPVFSSSSGYPLLEKNARKDFLPLVSGRVNLITPNLDEAQYLSGMDILNVRDAAEAARKIYDESGAACLITGGHFENDPVDYLYDGINDFYWKRKRLPGEVHGTGCFLSAAVLGCLVRKNELPEACRKAGDWTYRAIKNSIRLGKGKKILIP